LFFHGYDFSNNVKTAFYVFVGRHSLVAVVYNKINKNADSNRRPALALKAYCSMWGIARKSCETQKQHLVHAKEKGETNVTDNRYKSIV